MAATAPPGKRTDPRLPELEDPPPGWLKKLIKPLLILLAVVLVLAILFSLRVEMGFPVPAAGTLEPVRSWPIRAPAAGTVSDVIVLTGETVQLGDTVVRLDSVPAASTLNELQSKLGVKTAGTQKTTAQTQLSRTQQADAMAKARAKVVEARAGFQRALYTHGLGLVPLDLARATYRVGTYTDVDSALAILQTAETDTLVVAAQGQITSADTSATETDRIEVAELGAQVQTAQQQVQRMNVTSPAPGVMITPQAEKLLGAAVQPGDLLMEVTDPDLWSVTLTVAARDAKEIERGDSVQVRVPALDSVIKDPLRGTVLSVAPASTSKRAAGADSAAADTPYQVVAVLDIDQLAALGTSRFRQVFQVRAKIITREASLFEIAVYYLEKALGKVKLKK